MADSFNHRVQVFDKNGRFLQTWGSLGKQNGQFNSPAGIAVDNDGAVYIADTNNHRIQQFASDGSFVKAWGSYGSEDGQLTFPNAIAVNSDGLIYVADTFNNRVVVFDENGRFQQSWGDLSFPHGLAVDDDDNVYVADTFQHRIVKYSSDGTLLSEWGGAGSGEGSFNRPHAIAADHNNHIYVADTNNQQIQKFTEQASISIQLKGKDRGPITIAPATSDRVPLRAQIETESVVPQVAVGQMETAVSPANSTTPKTNENRPVIYGSLRAPAITTIIVEPTPIPTLSAPVSSSGDSQPPAPGGYVGLNNP